MVGFAVLVRAGLAVCRRLCLVLAVDEEVPGADNVVEEERFAVLVVLSSARALSVATPRANNNEVERRRSFIGWNQLGSDGMEPSTVRCHANVRLRGEVPVDGPLNVVSVRRATTEHRVARRKKPSSGPSPING